MKLFSLLAAAIAGVGLNALPSTMLNMNGSYRGPTPRRWRKGRIDKSNLPHGYPGAKMARKAIQRAIAVNHPRGLRTDDIGWAQQ